MAYVIDLSACINCGLCRKVCPTGCIHYYRTGRRTHVVEAAFCIDCDLCAKVCPMDCIRPASDGAPDAALRELAKARARAFARSKRAKVLAEEAELARALERMRGRVLEETAHA
jgi:NAD-dependent dihydropyrimidine dehydrogenase PreA subunit